ncbi:MAG: AAA family ATPase, partial [Candidatus Aenigmarchaeota archaeon]|nr:AAA family ATPase [Candidatus Aenigmarchaeota archaeon]
MRISFKNIGGVTNDLRFELKKGLNVIRAPNATGKTSFIRAFQTIILPDNELRKRGEFLNDFVDYGRVELSDENGNFSRTIRAGRQRDRLEVSGTPYWSDGNKVNLLTIAEPNNEFLNAILRGSSIEEYITRFSDVDVHKKLIKWIGEKIEENKRGLIRLDEQVS